MSTLRLLLGDQLNYRHSWFGAPDPEVVYLLMEMRQETDYVRHHAQKVIAFFASMYNFARYLEKGGHRVIHLRINDPENRQNLSENLRYFIEKLGIERFEYLEPDEYRLDRQLGEFCGDLTIPSTCYSAEHFLTRREELAEVFRGKKSYLMETFYRYMRKKHGVLMTGKDPEGGKWNFDASNRRPYKGEVPLPPPLAFDHDYRDIWEEILRAGVSTLGEPQAGQFPWPTTRRESLLLLRYFTQHLLPWFGAYQDAMTAAHPTLFHARLSFALNVKMLHPMEVIRAVEQAWQSDPDRIPLETCEGFIRQVLGWREYMRGIYWAQMPAFGDANYFGHTRKLPDFFWTGDTPMRCLSQAIRQSLDTAYAHHIQRLMITGNYALLAGVHPDEVDRWYLGIYIDAIEWVEITNTRGMSQYADGGLTASKPYVSTANYINKMSDYCRGCYFDKNQRYGPRACPFNSLYWHFHHRHRPLLEGNPRIGMAYRVWDGMEAREREQILAEAEGWYASEPKFD